MISIMEQSAGSSTLHQKLQLLQTLRSGDLDESHRLLTNLATTSRTHPEMYKIFHSFVTEHKEEIKAMERDEQEEQVQYVFEDAGSAEDEWETDDSVSFGSDTEEKEDKKQAGKAPVVFKNLSNSKSAVNLRRPSKDLKRPFYVQTKVAENQNAMSMSLKPESTGLKQINISNSSHKLSKTGLLPKAASKQQSKPYFPPIKGAMSSLKIENK